MGRGDVDDAADALLDHLRQHGLAAIPGAIQIDSEAAAPVFFGHLQRIAEHIDPGAVDQHIDAAMQFHGASGKGMQILLIRHVDLQCLHVMALIAPMGGDLLDLVSLDIADQQSGLLRGEGGNNRFADALSGTGQQHDLVFQALAFRRQRHCRQCQRLRHDSGPPRAGAKKPGIGRCPVFTAWEKKQASVANGIEPWRKADPA